MDIMFPGDLGQRAKVGGARLNKLPQAQQSKEADEEDGEEQQPVIRQWVRKMVVHKAEVISSEGCFLAHRTREAAQRPLECVDNKGRIPVWTNRGIGWLEF